MMTNYDVLMNSTEEECCKLLEEWKQSGIKAFDWLGANLAPGFTGWKDKNGKKIYEYDTLKFQGEDNEISSIYYYFVEMRKGKWSLSRPVALATSLLRYSNENSSSARVGKTV